jgi:hypothetical protein
MNSISYFSFFVLLYIFIGYKVAICRYRFAHSEAAETDAWSEEWRAYVFYPVTLGHKYTGNPSMEHAYRKALGPSRDIIPSVYSVEPSTYVMCMMWFWMIPFITTVVIWIVVGICIFLIMYVFLPIGVVFKALYRYGYRGMHFILPADLKKLDSTEPPTVTTEETSETT